MKITAEYPHRKYLELPVGAGTIKSSSLKCDAIPARYFTLSFILWKISSTMLLIFCLVSQTENDFTHLILFNLLWHVTFNRSPMQANSCNTALLSYVLLTVINISIILTYEWIFFTIFRKHKRFTIVLNWRCSAKSYYYRIILTVDRVVY